MINKRKIDVVIGTHRILSQDVFFKDLGLLIIDEEHRFGVKDKEVIKVLKQNVDVLSMTATPIPRTLAIIIYGDMDISVIDEVPAKRLPIKNCVVNQTYKDLEIIIVNDGSKDNSGELCKKWASYDERIIYIEKNNDKSR